MCIPSLGGGHLGCSHFGLLLLKLPGTFVYVMFMYHGHDAFPGLFMYYVRVHVLCTMGITFPLDCPGFDFGSISHRLLPVGCPSPPLCHIYW